MVSFLNSATTAVSGLLPSKIQEKLSEDYTEMFEVSYRLKQHLSALSAKKTKHM